MQGKALSFGNTDGNDIGRREAFDWYKNGAGNGMAFWYQNSGPWWKNANLKSNDGISLEEQIKDPKSLFQFYKKTIQLKQSHPALADGTYENVQNNNSKILSFYRIDKSQKVLVVFNLSNESQVVKFDTKIQNPMNLIDKRIKFGKELMLNPYQFMVWQVK